MVEEKHEEIFSDKEMLSSTMLAKEFFLIELYNSLAEKITTGELDKQEACESNYFFNAWRNLMELYEFLEFDYAISWGRLKDNSEEYQKLIEIIAKYRKFEHNLTFSDLEKAYIDVRRVMAHTGFHSVSTDLKPNKKAGDFPKLRMID